MNTEILADSYRPELSFDQFSTTSETYFSCDYLQSGLCFSVSSLHPCAIVHHGTGEPKLVDYRGGPVPVEQSLAARANIIQQNQQEGYPNCRGCPHLTRKQWSRPDYPIQWLGITNWLGCNLRCDYCWLQWDEKSPRNSTSKVPLAFYDVSESIHQLIDQGYLDPNAIIDWGGGGEPLLMPGFEKMLVLLNKYGTTQWIHTNGTILPRSIRDRTIDCSRIRILCSVDAGSPKTYESIKGSNLYDKVWSNLKEYIAAGSLVTVKYLLEEKNCSLAELRSFIKKALSSGKPAILGDIDHRFPNSTPEILNALAYLQLLAHKYDLGYSLGGVGYNSVNATDFKAQIEERFPYVYHDRYLYPKSPWIRLVNRLRQLFGSALD